MIIQTDSRHIPRRKFPITSEISEAIVKLYHRSTGNGQVLAFAESIGYPRWKITRYAIQCGLIAKQKKEPNWSDSEIHILELNARYQPEVIQRKLKKSGFSRSVTGIVLKRKRMRFTKNLEGMSATSLAKCLGVDAHFVMRAIKGNRLKADKKGTNRIEIQGGDSYFIEDRDIKKYILTWLNEIDIRKVDKYWFCDLLSGSH